MRADNDHSHITKPMKRIITLICMAAAVLTGTGCQNMSPETKSQLAAAGARLADAAATAAVNRIAGHPSK